MIFVQQIRSNQDGFFRTYSWTESLLKNSRLIPGNRLDNNISNSGTLSGKRELLQYSRGSRQHFLEFKIWKPEAQIKRISHSNVFAFVLIIVNVQKFNGVLGVSYIADLVFGKSENVNWRLSRCEIYV